MNAAAKPAGLQVGSTRPLSRAERRAAAARVQAEKTEGDVTNNELHAGASTAAAGNQHLEPPQDDTTPEQPSGATADEPPPAPPKTEHLSSGAVKLRARQRVGKRPFATQLHTSTIARLEWIMRNGYVLTDTVDEAINAYLDAAGIPRPDDHDRMPSPG